jgi:catechol 2,3-dioxygenase-like lactoylglutathione lyase family enzyme
MFCQVALVVEDIEAVSRAWAAVLGVDVPAWSLPDTEDVAHTRYNGAPTTAQAKLAFFNLTPQVQLELIEPVGGPSTWRDQLDAHGTSLHHVAFSVKGMDQVIARLEAADMKLVQRGDYTGGCYAYVDGGKTVGAVLELLENF